MGRIQGSLIVTRAQPTTSATLVLALNPKRFKATIQNVKGAETVYLSASPSVTITTGIELVAGTTLTDKHTVTAWYGVTATGTGDLRAAELTS